MNAKTQFLFVFTFVIVLLQYSCFEPTEGCLDIEATNFDASADDACLDCCTYPQLKLSVFHALTSDNWNMTGDSCVFHSSDSTFQNISNTSSIYQLDNMVYYLSDFRLVSSTGEVFQVSDTIQLNILDNAITFEEKDTTVVDDFILVKRLNSSYTIGEFIAPGLFEKIQFKVGLLPRLNTTNPDTLDSSHPLAISRDSMHTGIRNTGYLMQRFEVIRDTMSQPDSYSYSILDPFSNTIEIELDYQFTIQPGFDVTIPLKVNYSKWLSGIDFAEDEDGDIKAKFVTNTPEAFSIDP